MFRSHEKRVVARMQILLGSQGKILQKKLDTYDELNVTKIKTCEISVISNNYGMTYKETVVSHLHLSCVQLITDLEHQPVRPRGGGGNPLA